MYSFRLKFILTALLISAALSYGCAGAAPAPDETEIPTTAQSSVALSSTSNWSPAPAVTIDVPVISVQDAYNLIQINKDNPDFKIIDVRTAGEFDSGHLAGAINIDYYAPGFRDDIGKLDRDKEYLIFCRTGIRSAAAAQIMMELGFLKVYSLSGGIRDWTDAGYPVVQ